GRLGTREPGVYGTTSCPDLVEMRRVVGAELGRDAEVRQTAAEPEMLPWLPRAADGGGAVGRTPGARPHSAHAVRAGCGLLRGPLVEVHISNIHAREAFRHHSVVSAVATGVICGLGVDGYRLALLHLARGASATPA